MTLVPAFLWCLLCRLFEQAVWMALFAVLPAVFKGSWRDPGQ